MEGSLWGCLISNSRFSGSFESADYQHLMVCYALLESIC